MFLIWFFDARTQYLTTEVIYTEKIFARTSPEIKANNVSSKILFILDFRI